MNQGRFITRNARYWPDRPATLFKDQAITFRELDERSSRLANALLALGARKGDRIAVQSWNRPELIELECALYKAGLVKVALNARLSPAEVRETIANAEPVIMLAGPGHGEPVSALRADLAAAGVMHFIGFGGFGGDCDGFLSYEELLRQAPPESPDTEMQSSDLAVLHYTSGSTGKLKAAMQTVGNRMASLRKVVMGRLRAGPGDVLALAGPITHASGMFIQPFLFQGGTILLHERFEPEAFLASIEKHRVTACFLVPTMINMIVAHPKAKAYDLGSLKQVTYGSAPMSPARIKEAWEVFGPVLSQGYGAGETTGGLVALTTEDHREAIDSGRIDMLASCGRIFSESELRLVDDDGKEVAQGEVGEIVIRGPDIFAGYWREPGLTAAAIKDGWLHTGDLAKMDPRGYIYIVDRKKDMVISGGFNVYPTEVEQALYLHPAVYEVCVVGVPHATWGEAIKAVVVLRPGHQATESELIEHCRAYLADFKKPRSVDFVAELPKNGNGKLSRKDVKERYWSGQERRVA
ncbi:Acyl-CoA synthetase (AMP-forming)/AMP-acid ligase II [Noviherbaspirillum humi]|uniref:Acyl-CoA synthetase (AMP-forming)/AMP-acid ligase II n=1 Tax=Noviherbaspirillum humi TaxID=1688639 RepID=A0A239EZD5_9BURK|nr:long-chain fatty acid--CoA ligase [Noviherbaspirillum humi]SNS49821.1 Acyl-CoA synthetase (AMP-forming)/AMP-acid ligase II [Noviherbaspirillum humi]